MHNWVYSSSSALEALLKTVINKRDMFEFRILHTLNAEVFDFVCPELYKKAGTITVLIGTINLGVNLVIFGHVCLFSVGLCIVFNEARSLGILLGIL